MTRPRPAEIDPRVGGPGRLREWRPERDGCARCNAAAGEWEPCGDCPREREGETMQEGER